MHRRATRLAVVPRYPAESPVRAHRVPKICISDWPEKLGHLGNDTIAYRM